MSAATPPSAAQALTDTLLEITRIDSWIGEEKALCDHVQARLARTLPASAIARFQDSLVVRVNEQQARKLPRVALVGHLDTVRTVHDGPARIEGDKLYGAGSADMKSGLAVMIELAERVDRDKLPCELILVFYEREEGPFAENQLGPMLDHFQLLRELDLAICLEPSNNHLQLGCMGSVHATVRFRGRTAHSARPWQGENALYKALPFLQLMAAKEPREVTLDGYVFKEIASVTVAGTTGRGRNVVPDEFDVNVNYRFAPTRTPDDAIAELRSWVGDAAEVVPTDAAPAGRPHAGNALVKKLIDAGVASVAIKQAWTDVARFDAIGVPAVNFGPGTQNQAHQRNEWTELGLLPDGFAILWRFLHSL